MSHTETAVYWLIMGLWVPVLLSLLTQSLKKTLAAALFAACLSILFGGVALRDPRVLAFCGDVLHFLYGVFLEHLHKAQAA